MEGYVCLSLFAVTFKLRALINTFTVLQELSLSSAFRNGVEEIEIKVKLHRCPNFKRDTRQYPSRGCPLICTDKEYWTCHMRNPWNPMEHAEGREFFARQISNALRLCNPLMPLRGPVPLSTHTAKQGTVSARTSTGRLVIRFWRVVFTCGSRLQNAVTEVVSCTYVLPHIAVRMFSLCLAMSSNVPVRNLHLMNGW